VSIFFFKVALKLSSSSSRGEGADYKVEYCRFRSMSFLSTKEWSSESFSSRWSFNKLRCLTSSKSNWVFSDYLVILNKVSISLFKDFFSCLKESFSSD